MFVTSPTCVIWAHSDASSDGARASPGQMLNRTQLADDIGMSVNTASARLLGIQSLELAGGRAIGTRVRPDVRIVGPGRDTALRSRL